MLYFHSIAAVTEWQKPEGLVQTRNKGFIVCIVHGGRDASRVMIVWMQRCFKPTSLLKPIIETHIILRANQKHNIIK
jgi:hypothetical protein